MSELISPREAAKITGVSPNTLRNWEEAGKLTSVKTMGGHRRYKLSEIKQLVDKSNSKDCKEE
jgi:excisionase family DNA binding protein